MSEIKSELLAEERNTSKRMSIELTSNKLAIFATLILSNHQQMAGMYAIISYSAEIFKIVYPPLEKTFPIFFNL